MKIACLSDLHGHLPSVPDCDLVVLAGDLCASDGMQDQMKFLNGPFRRWCDNLPAPLVLTAGNHDWALERYHYEIWDGLNAADNTDFLLDDRCFLNGPNCGAVWGCPWSLPFMDWAFMASERDISNSFDLCPPKLLVLVSHGPPKGILDRSSEGKHCGSSALLKEIKARRPRLVVFGHIHEARGVKEIDGITYVNAAYVDEDYRPYREGVIVVELERKNNA